MATLSATEQMFVEHPEDTAEVSNYYRTLFNNTKPREREIEQNNFVATLRYVLSDTHQSLKALLTSKNIDAVLPQLKEAVSQAKKVHILAFNDAHESLKSFVDPDSIWTPPRPVDTFENLIIADGDRMYTWNPFDPNKKRMLYGRGHVAIDIVNTRFDAKWQSYTMKDLSERKPKKSFFRRLLGQ